MPVRPYIQLRVLLAFACAGVLASARAETGAAVSDSLLTLPELVVVGESGGVSDPAEVTFTPAALATIDPWHAGDLEPLLPAATVNVNSRGESLLMIRGAPERHAAVTLDGIPLAVPWDERADLSLVPLDGTTSVMTLRGPVSLLHGPNSVAGSLHLRTADNGAPRLATSFQGAQMQDLALRAAWRGRTGSWRMLTAGSFRSRDAVPLPAGLETSFHQNDDSRRNNSDLRQASFLAAAERTLAGGGRLSLLLTGADAEKGVPPETHLDTEARLWRIPQARRVLLGGAVELPLSPDWNLEGMTALDVHAQDIRPYTSDLYNDPAPVAGDDLEQGRDLTNHLKLRLGRDLGTASTFALQLQSRYTQHRERLTVDGPESRYAQWLGSLTAELDLVVDRSWTVRTGLGLDRSSTPETGSQPSRDALHDTALLLRVGRELGSAARAHLAYSHRSRFPALRELYSGALGRFVPNPELAPEVQDLYETGLSVRTRGWEGGLTGFVSHLADGIEKEVLPDHRFRRINRSRLRSYGLEAVLARRFGRNLTFSIHHTLVDVEADDGQGTSTRPAEDRPSHLGSLLAGWRIRSGWRLDVVGHWLGRRASADAADTVDGLRALPAQAWWDFWVSRRFECGHGRAVELRVGARNVFDKVLMEQAGLPGPGRTLIGGVRFEAF